MRRQQASSTLVSKDLGTETKFAWSSKHPSEWEWIQRRNGSRGNMSASAHIKWAFKGSALRLHRRPRTLQHKWMVNTWNRRFSTGGLRPQSGSESFVGHFPLFIHFFKWFLKFGIGNGAFLKQKEMLDIYFEGHTIKYNNVSSRQDRKCARVCICGEIWVPRNNL